MIFLWNKERVLSEILELARLRISAQLEIPVAAIGVKLQLEGDSVKPAFSVAVNDIPDIEPEQLQSTMSEVWRGLRGELIKRLASVEVRRYGCG